MKDRMNGIKTYVEHNPSQGYMPVIEVDGYGKVGCPGAHWFATEKGAENWLEKWETHNKIMKVPGGFKIV